MSIENRFGFIAWNTEGNSDKIWGFFYRPTPDYIAPRWGDVNHGRNVCVFWGRRGKAMQFKADVSGHKLDKLVQSKLKKGYLKIDQPKLMNIWPSFITEAEDKLMWDVLAGKIA
jgi:hypothetical protein